MNKFSYEQHSPHFANTNACNASLITGAPIPILFPRLVHILLLAHAAPHHFPLHGSMYTRFIVIKIGHHKCNWISLS